MINDLNSTVSITVPTGTIVTALQAVFTTTGAKVFVGGIEQVSGVTANDFTTPVVYTIAAADNSTQSYTVRVTVAPSTAKAITSFSILGVAGIIDENAKTIRVTLPEDTNVTTLIALFTTTGSVVVVNAKATTQVSGVTPNDFTKPVVYTVKAADGSSVNYKVTISTVVLGTLITSPTVTPNTIFAQTLVSHDTGTLNASSGYYQESFPGEANVWNIDADFTLYDGGDYQLFYALKLSFNDTTSFEYLAYDDLTFYGPTMGTAQGVKVADVSSGRSSGFDPLSGTYSAFLYATSDSRLMQTLNLPSVDPNTDWISLTWLDDCDLYEGNFMPGYTPNYRVAIRDTSGALLEDLTLSQPWGDADLTAYQGRQVVLSFEEQSMPDIGYPTMIDSVSVVTASVDSFSTGTIDYVTNGDFETRDLTGWTTNTPAEVQNMTSSAKKHDGLDVRRSFYTVPNKLWGRWVDMYENNTTSAITTTINYETVLGSCGSAIIYETPSTNQWALTVWEGTQTSRDIGMVFGKADLREEYFTSDDILNDVSCVGAGSDTIEIDYHITVPPGGRVALVNFIILGTYDTSLNAADTSTRATQIDREALKIVNNFWTDPQYRDGMTQQQIDAVINFPQ